MEPTDANLMGELRAGGLFQNYHIRDLCLANCTGIGRNPTPLDVQNLLDGYDFIGITEYMAESLVVMQMLLGLTTADIVHLCPLTWLL